MWKVQAERKGKHQVHQANGIDLFTKDTPTPTYEVDSEQNEQKEPNKKEHV